ncbi:unnamed protein product [Caenorhabditis brenneri]
MVKRATSVWLRTKRRATGRPHLTTGRIERMEEKSEAKRIHPRISQQLAVIHRWNLNVSNLPTTTRKEAKESQEFRRVQGAQLAKKWAEADRKEEKEPKSDAGDVVEVW